MGGGGKKGSKKKSKKKLKGKAKLASLGRAPKSALGKTKAQKQFAANKAKYGTAAAAKANKAAGIKVAADRHKKFKQTGVQTFGGKNFLLQKKRQTTKAGYSVDGYSKAPAKSDTQLQVDRDNKLYGNTAPVGGFNISEEGQKVAAAQLSEKKLANKELARLEKVDPGTANYIKSLAPNIQTDALIGGRTQAPGAELAIGIGTLGLGKMLLGEVS